MIKQIIGIIFLLSFIGYLGSKFYNAIEGNQYASLIMYFCSILLIVVLLGVGKQLKGD